MILANQRVSPPDRSDPWSLLERSGPALFTAGRGTLNWLCPGLPSRGGRGGFPGPGEPSNVPAVRDKLLFAYTH
jgi:hypothetical protein